MTTSAALRDAFAATLDPIREQLERIDTEIATKKAELDELRALRRGAERVLHALEPTSRNGAKPPARRKSTPVLRSSEAKLEEVYAFIRERWGPDDEFTVSDVIKRPDFDIVTKSTLQTIIRTLADRGRLRLNRVAPHARGRGARHFKLTASDA